MTAQFLRFGLVGTIGFVVDAAVLQILVSLAHGDPFVSRIFSYLAAATVTWAIHRQYTFRDRLPVSDGTRVAVATAFETLISQWARFVVSNGLGALINFAVYSACLLSWALCKDNPVLGVAAGSVAGLAFNYTVSRHFVFK